MKVAKSSTRRPSPKQPPKPEVEFFWDVEQAGAEWFALRMGIPTASKFGAVMADGRNGEDSKTRTSYMNRLAGELLTGVPDETFRSKAMQRGHEMEPEAREYYARTTFSEMTPVGFVRRRLPSGRFVGCSPDSFVGGMVDGRYRKGLEVKTHTPALLIDLARRGVFPVKHRPQVFGTMWVAELDEVDLQLFYRGMPIAPRFTVRRDELYIKEISQAVEVFDDDLHRLVEDVRKMGGRR